MAYKFLNANEQVLMEGKANKTVKTTFSSKLDEIPLNNIATSADCFNLLIPSGNMIKVCTNDGKTHQFLVVGKQKEDWKHALTTVVNMLRG